MKTVYSGDAGHVCSQEFNLNSKGLRVRNSAWRFFLPAVTPDSQKKKKKKKKKKKSLCECVGVAVDCPSTVEGFNFCTFGLE